MQIIIKKMANESNLEAIYIDENKVILKENSDEQEISVSEKERYNTLIVLFGLKEEWKENEIKYPQYSVYFNNDDEEKIYNFNLDNLPDNWLLFQTYVARLVGESYE